MNKRGGYLIKEIKELNMLLALFIQYTSSWESGPSNDVQILIAIGFITTVVGFFLKK
ncbi:hypothetical protein [Neobacillus notoginsengisoli]|uniref:hypothetical protein n=1 Tax=Neobacillus notoginsengisoli TaxID=1578198 RepID=UPI00195AEE88|nr:hypothetical protein [Neobacillus notoginsengisoli]